MPDTSTNSRIVPTKTPHAWCQRIVLAILLAPRAARAISSSRTAPADASRTCRLPRSSRPGNNSSTCRYRPQSPRPHRSPPCACRAEIPGSPCNRTAFNVKWHDTAQACQKSAWRKHKSSCGKKSTISTYVQQARKRTDPIRTSLTEVCQCVKRPCFVTKLVTRSAFSIQETRPSSFDMKTEATCLYEGSR